MITGNCGTMNVFIDRVKLDPAPSQALYNHSPDGFAWGYGGSGPAQLALALLLHFTDQEFALNHYQRFKFDVIARCDQTRNLKLETKTIMEWAEKHGYEGQTK